MNKILVGAFTAILFSLSAHGWAANYSDPIDGTFKGIYGDTISIEVPSQVSKSPVDRAYQNGDLSFQFNASTAYKNFSQLTDLKPGDAVKVEYTEGTTDKTKDLVMLATTITKIEPPLEPASVNTVTTDSDSVPAVTQTVVTTTTTQAASQ